MARGAAAKRTPHPHPEHHGRDRRPSGGGAAEQTLFFQRIRRQAKWVFVFLAIVFAGSFVVFGVGSGSSGIGDLLRGNFSGIFGGGSSSGSPSVDKAQKEIQKNPSNAQAYHDLALAYEQKTGPNGEVDQADVTGAIGALESYIRLKPNDAGAMRELAAEYGNRAGAQYGDLQAIQYDVQSAQTSTFGPAPNTTIGKALASKADPIEQAVTAAASGRFSQAQTAYAATLRAIEETYRKIVKLDPTDGQSLIQYAQAAQQVQDIPTAITGYQKFLKLFPDDPSAAYAKQQLKALGGSVSGSSGG